VTDALNFSTADCHIIGSCDLYTTKAAGGDKKLYKNIENTLESQHESLVRLSKSISPPQIPIDSRTRLESPPVQPDIDLSRDSAFGSLSQHSARRTFAYLIATLNASHADYDFSNILRPHDFRRISGTDIKKAVDGTMLHLRPRRLLPVVASPNTALLSSSAPGGLTGDTVWSAGMWDLMDKEMDLRQCVKYVWEPEDDPFEEEAGIWSQHYFYFNKEQKRVCYLHFGAFSVLSHSPMNSGIQSKSSITGRSSIRSGNNKRAQYWLGNSADNNNIDGDSGWAEGSDDEFNGDSSSDLNDIREHLQDGYWDHNDDQDDADLLDADVTAGWRVQNKGKPRTTSESIADAMEL